MYCRNCNKHFGKEYVVCPECGEILEEEVRANPETHDDDDFGFFEDEIVPVWHGDAPPDRSGLYITLSILQLLFCNMITGIVSLIFAAKGSSNYSDGNYEAALKNWKTAKIALWIGVGLFVASIVFMIVFALSIVNAFV